jgi:two-component system, chemotaxis family, chemotaxis protein CheY
VIAAADNWIDCPLVLLVEDNDHLREALSEIIETRGFRVRTASDGEEGLDLLRSGLRPDAVFLDQCLPRLDGAQVLATMKGDPALAAIPVVWMSGDWRNPPSSVAACLEKPFAVEDLLDLLGALCDAD